MIPRVRLPSLAVGVCLVVSGLAAQQTPVFRSAVDLVTVDATVVDNRGQPIPGLGPEDFSLEVDGVPRRIVSIQFVSRGTTVVSRRGIMSGRPIGSTSNEVGSDSRLILIAVDQANIRRLEGRATLRAAADFLGTLGPRDRIAVAPVNYAGEIEFHTDRIRARQELERLTGESDPALVESTFNLGLTEALYIADGNRVRLDQASRRECGASLARINDPARAAAASEGARDPCPVQIEQEARAVAQLARTRATLSLDELLDMIARLKSIDEPKTLVLLSEGLVAEPQLVDLTALGAAAQDARVTIYVMQLETPFFDASTDRVSPTFTEDIQLRADGLARLAGAARGALFHQVGRDPEPFQRIARELSGYYLLAFEPIAADRDGRAHRIHVSLSGVKATLRSRTAFRLTPAPVAMRQTEQRIIELLRAGSMATELPLRAATYAYYQPASGRVRLVISAETEATSAGAAEVMFGYVLLNPQGVIVSSDVLETSSRRFLTEVVIDPGVFTLKVAAIDRFGRSGSVPRAVLAGISDTQIPISDLMIARGTGQPADALDPILEATDADRVVAYLELYPADSQSLRDVDVLVSVRPADGGRPLPARPAVLASHEPRRATARLVLPTGDLPAGRYVVRATVTESGREVGFVERAFSISR